MTPAHILEQKLRAAEDEAADWKRRAEHAQSQVHMATLRMQQAEQTTDGVVKGIAMLLRQRCTCTNCEHRERGME